MKILAGAVLLSALSTGAFAADLPSHKAPPAQPFAAAPLFSWTGFYVGANVGYADPGVGIGVAPGGAWVGDPDGAGVAAAGARKLTLAGVIGGVQAGYNFQFDHLVLGVEFDANGLGLSSSYATPTFNGLFGGTYSANGKVSANYILTARPRIGVAVDHFLFYLTGGLAIANENFSQSVNFINTAVAALPQTAATGGSNAGRVSRANASWTLGGGVEYAFSDRWSAKFEYLYANLGNLRFNSSYGPNAFTNGTWTMAHQARFGGLNIFRVGLNYRFGG